MENKETYLPEEVARIAKEYNIFQHYVVELGRTGSQLASQSLLETGLPRYLGSVPENIRYFLDDCDLLKKECKRILLEEKCKKISLEEKSHTNNAQ